MFVQEIVPPETLFICSVRAHGGAFPVQQFPPVIRIGGDETIGRGLTRVTPV
jgi:CRISPR/Cas system CMR subunit Cmr4 (Cas7 group RAMP superfamily)